MNRCGIFALIALVLRIYTFAGDAEKDYHFQTYVSDLALCDRVEVIKIGEEAGQLVGYLPEPGKLEKGAGQSVGNIEWVLPDDKTNLYRVEPLDQWYTITARTAIKGQAAERIAALYRALKLRKGDHNTPKDHSPSYAYRFYAGDKLLCEASVDPGGLGVDGFLLAGAEGERRFQPFDTRTKETEALFRASNRLFPQLPRYPVPRTIGRGRTSAK